MRFLPKIARNCIIKGVREARIQWEREVMQGIRDGRQANRRKQTLKRPGADQEKVPRWPKRTVENGEWRWARPTLDTSIRDTLSLES